MTAAIIDGKAFAAKVRGMVAEHVAGLQGLVPGLAVVLGIPLRRTAPIPPSAGACRTPSRPTPATPPLAGANITA